MSARSGSQFKLPVDWRAELRTLKSGRTYWVYHGPSSERLYSLVSVERSVSKPNIPITKKKYSVHGLSALSKRHSRPSIPHSGSVPAGEEFPGWTVERVECLNGTPFVLYRDAAGRPVGNRKAALQKTGQLTPSLSAIQVAKKASLNTRKHKQMLKRDVDMSQSTARRHMHVNASYECSRTDACPQKDVLKLGAWEKGAYVNHISTLFDFNCTANNGSKPTDVHTAAHAVNAVVIDMFCGAGGLSMGFKAAGFSHILGVDYDKLCIQTYRHNACGEKSICAEIRAKDALAWKRAVYDAGLRSDDNKSTVPLVVVGGPPCQPYSQMGRQYGTADDRDGIQDMLTLVFSMQPDIFIIENVENLLTGVFDAQIQPLLKEAQDLGYAIDAHILNSKLHGVPQSRKRLFICGIMKCSFKQHTLPVSVQSDCPVPVPLDAIQDKTFWTESCPAKFKPTLSTLAARHERNRCVLDKGVITALHVCPTILTTSLSQNNIHRLLALPVDIACRNIKWKHCREIQIEQLQQLQSFSQQFKFCGNTTSQNRQLGNAVPPRLAYDIGKAVMEILKTRVCPRQATLMKVDTHAQASHALRRLKISLANNVL